VVVLTSSFLLPNTRIDLGSGLDSIALVNRWNLWGATAATAPTFLLVPLHYS